MHAANSKPTRPRSAGLPRDGFWLSARGKTSSASAASRFGVEFIWRLLSRRMLPDGGQSDFHYVDESSSECVLAKSMAARWRVWAEWNRGTHWREWKHPR